MLAIPHGGNLPSEVPTNASNIGRSRMQANSCDSGRCKEICEVVGAIACCLLIAGGLGYGMYLGGHALVNGELEDYDPPGV